MSDLPIIFSGEMVRAILSRRKTQTRRVMWPHNLLYPYRDCMEKISVRISLRSYLFDLHHGDGTVSTIYGIRKQKYLIGDRLWVRETFDIDWHYDEDGHKEPEIYYRADLSPDDDAGGWKPSIYMPRWASRITLEITNVRCQRLQEISESDAESEGVDFIPSAPAALDHRTAFAGFWDKLNAKKGYSWKTNPWVWVIDFKVIK